MIKLRIQEIAATKGITNAYGLGKAMNVKIGQAVRLWRGVSMISLNTIDQLCDALDCEPADLIVRVKAKRKSATRPRRPKLTGMI